MSFHTCEICYALVPPEFQEHHTAWHAQLGHGPMFECPDCHGERVVVVDGVTFACQRCLGFGKVSPRQDPASSAKLPPSDNVPLSDTGNSRSVVDFECAHCTHQWRAGWIGGSLGYTPPCPECGSTLVGSEVVLDPERTGGVVFAEGFDVMPHPDTPTVVPVDVEFPESSEAPISNTDSKPNSWLLGWLACCATMARNLADGGVEDCLRAAGIETEEALTDALQKDSPVDIEPLLPFVRSIASSSS